MNDRPRIKFPDDRLKSVADIPWMPGQRQYMGETPEFEQANVFGAQLKNFIEQAMKFPYLFTGIPGVTYDPATQTLTIQSSVRVKVDGTLHVETAKNFRMDSGDRLFLNSKFTRERRVDDEKPIFPKHVPYSDRSTTTKVRMKNQTRRPGKGGCGCGGKCGH